MNAVLLDGKKTAARLRAQTGARIAAHLAAGRRAPGLAVVLTGENAASQVYVRNKVKACAEAGIQSFENYLSAEVGQDELLRLVKSLNARDEVDGILIQLPLPAPLNAQPLIDVLDPVKDIDGFTAENAGRLLHGRSGHRPCTPAGVMELLREYGVPLAGRRVVVVGRSNIVGKPMAQLLIQADATVTVAHSRTADLAKLCREAEIVVAALGRPAALSPDHFAPGAIAIDVGINRVEQSALVDEWFPGDTQRRAQFDKTGSTLVGDVDPRAFAKLSAYTPVPGGVGPLTIAMLLHNTLAAYEHRLSIAQLF